MKCFPSHSPKCFPRHSLRCYWRHFRKDPPKEFSGQGFKDTVKLSSIESSSIGFVSDEKLQPGGINNSNKSFFRVLNLKFISILRN